MINLYDLLHRFIIYAEYYFVVNCRISLYWYLVTVFGKRGDGSRGEEKMFEAGK